MSDLKRFLRGIPSGLWTVIIVFVIIVCALPAILTLPGLLDFSNTGEIGDTIGGIMGPFIAILAALLTFIAFWAQFDANRELIKENRRNHFENRFYKMLDIHLQSVADLNSRFKSVEADSCFHVWCNELTNLCDLLRTQGDLGGIVSEIRNKFKNDPNHKDFISFIDTFSSSKEEYEKIIFEISYTYFFTKNFATIKYGDSQETRHIREFAIIYAAHLSDMKIELGGNEKTELLGRYYRHLFQIVKFVDEQPNDLFEEKNWKSEYLSVLRSQMSDYEQLLLYYNSQSSIGNDWNEKHYIENYKLIKNIPYLEIAFCAGTAPIVMYEKAIKEAEEKGEKFFERY